MPVPYPGWNVVYGEIPAASKWSQLGANDDALAAGTALNDNAVVNRHISDGAVGRAELAIVAKRINPRMHDRMAAMNNAMFPEAGATGARFTFVIPADYVSGDLSVTLLYRAGAGGGVMHIVRSVYRFRPNVALLAIVEGLGVDVSTADTTTRSFTFTIAAANFAVGDTIRLDLTRNQGDSSTSVVEFDGLSVEYNGRA